MNHIINFSSPLEQFNIVPLLFWSIESDGVGVVNETVFVTLITFILSILSLSFIKPNGSSYYLIPNRWQYIMELIYNLVLSLTSSNIKGEAGARFFPFLFGLFCFIFCLNTVGLVPGSFTLTSHFIISLGMSTTIFIGINIVCLRLHGVRFFSLFLPAGTSSLLAFLLVPIEIVSYIFKPISLSIRLFANMMAGHTLLKVIAGFGLSLMDNTGALFALHWIPLFILVPLLGLECAVALIQTFVASILTSIYLNDSLNLH